MNISAFTALCSSRKAEGSIKHRPQRVKTVSGPVLYVYMIDCLLAPDIIRFVGLAGLHTLGKEGIRLLHIDFSLFFVRGKAPLHQ